MSKHPEPRFIVRGMRLFHVSTNQYVNLCNCASVANYRKVGWAKSHPSEYYLTKPVDNPVETPVVVEVAIPVDNPVDESVTQLGNSGVESAE